MGDDMNSEEDEFQRIEAEAKRRAAQDDADTPVYTSEMLLAKAYRFGFEAGAVAEREACAKVCEGRLQEGLNFEGCATAIRARGTT